VQGLEDHYLKHRRILLGLGAAGLLTWVVGLFLAPQRAWASLLLGNFYFLSLALCGLVFVALTYIFSAGWAVVFRRVPEAMSAYLPFGALVMLAIFLFGRATLYPWARPEAVALQPHLQHKAAYLNPPFFLLRLAVAFGLWLLFAHLLRHHSQRQDADGDLVHTRKNQAFAALFLLLFTATFILSSIDWLMSLEPEWYSTIFPLYAFAGLFMGGTAAMIVLVIQFQRRGLLSGVTHHHLYELARLLGAASTFWAYVWFSQYMLIYYTNIPEEAVYYVHRVTGARWLLFSLNLVLNWVLPLVILIPASTRRSAQWLLRVCALVLVGRWLDLYLLILPALGQPLRFGFPELFIPLGFLPLFVLPLVACFRKAEPVPRQDPYLIESVQLRV